MYSSRMPHILLSIIPFGSANISSCIMHHCYGSTNIIYIYKYCMYIIIYIYKVCSYAIYLLIRTALYDRTQTHLCTHTDALKPFAPYCIHFMSTRYIYNLPTSKISAFIPTRRTAPASQPINRSPFHNPHESKPRRSHTN